MLGKPQELKPLIKLNKLEITCGKPELESIEFLDFYQEIKDGQNGTNSCSFDLC